MFWYHKRKKWHQTPFAHANAGKLVSNAVSFGTDLSGYGINSAISDITTHPQNPVPYHPLPVDLPVILLWPGRVEAERPATVGTSYLLC